MVEVLLAASLLLVRCKPLSNDGMPLPRRRFYAIRCNEEGKKRRKALGSSFQTASIAFYVVLNVEKHDGKACDITC